MRSLNSILKTQVPIGRDEDRINTKSITIADFLLNVKSGMYESDIQAYRKNVDASKRKGDFIDGVQPHRLFISGQNRACMASIKTPVSGTKLSGVIVVDIDNAPVDQVDTMVVKIIASGYFFAAFKSPSGNGIKAFGYHNITDANVFCDANRDCTISILNALDMLDYYDHMPTNVNSLCYASHDPNIKINIYAQPWPLEPFIEAREALNKKLADISQLLETYESDKSMKPASPSAIEKVTKRWCDANQTMSSHDTSFKLACALVTINADDYQIRNSLITLKDMVEHYWPDNNRNLDIEEQLRSARRVATPKKSTLLSPRQRKLNAKALEIQQQLKNDKLAAIQRHCSLETSK